MNYLLRHAPSVANEENLVYGALDSPVSHSGRYVAECLGRVMMPKYFDRAYVSTASRTKDTFKLAGLAAGQMIFTPALDECHKGELEGMKEEEALPFIRPVLSDPSWRFPGEGGESVNDMNARVANLVDNAAKQRKRGENVIFVTSAGPIKGYLSRKLGISHKDGFGLAMPNCGVYRFCLDVLGRITVLEHLVLKREGPSEQLWKDGLYPNNGRHESVFMQPAR